MKIFIAGASGAVSSQLVAHGHKVVGMTRSTVKISALRALGAEPVIVDARGPDSVADVVAEAESKVIVHRIIALSGPMKMRNVKRIAAATDRLRLRAPTTCWPPRAVDVGKFVAQAPVVVAICWARVIRRDHTVLQAVAGLVVGATVAAAVMAPLA